MAKVLPLQQTFTKGMRRDEARDQMDPASLWTIDDWLIDYDAPLTKRGGWTYGSNDFGGTATRVTAGYYAPFATGAKNCAIDEDGKFNVIASDGSVTVLGATVGDVHRRLGFHRERLIIPQDNGIPYSYDGATLAALAGTPPSGRCVTVYKDRTVLANTPALPHRLYYSGPGDPTSWDTNSAWVDATFPVVGLAALSNALLVFSNQMVERIRGATPPPASDMTIEPLVYPGCNDDRSIATWKEFVIFANQEGIFITDGAAVEDLTRKVGLSRLWRETLIDYPGPATSSIAGGVFMNHYVVSYVTATGIRLCLLFDLIRMIAVRLTNVPATGFWSSIGTAPELWWGLYTEARVGKFSPIVAPSANNKIDANGVEVLPRLETRWQQISQAPARIKDIYLSYDLRDVEFGEGAEVLYDGAVYDAQIYHGGQVEAENPTLIMSYVDSPEEVSWRDMTGPLGSASSLERTTELTRARQSVRMRAHGLAVRVQQTNPSAATRIYGIGLSGHGLEDSRLAA